MAHGRERAGVREARVAWLAILLSTTAIILAVVYAVGDLVARTLLHVLPPA